MGRKGGAARSLETVGQRGGALGKLGNMGERGDPCHHGGKIPENMVGPELTGRR